MLLSETILQTLLIVCSGPADFVHFTPFSHPISMPPKAPSFPLFLHFAFWVLQLVEKQDPSI